MHILVRELARHLPKLAQAVQYPETAPVRGRHQIVVLDSQVVHRHDREVAPHRMPVVSVVERHVDAGLGSNVQQTRTLVVLADAAGEVVIPEVAGDGLPGCPVVRGLEQERPVVVELVPRRGQIRRRRVVRRHLYHVHPRPLLQIEGSDILPVLAAVLRYMYKPVVRARPEDSLLMRGLHKGEDGAVGLRAGCVPGYITTRRLELVRVVAREVRADRLPAPALVS